MSQGKYSTWQKYLALTLISIAVGVIYKVPYLREVFYEPLKQGLGITNTEIGFISTVFGTTSTLLFIVGGLVADKFNAKKILTWSMLAMGALTFWYSTVPSYNQILIIMVGMGCATTLGFWSAFLKALNILGGENEQGRMYGISEGVRAVAGMLVAFAALYCIELATTATEGLKYTLIFYGIVYVLIGLGIWAFLPDVSEEKSEEDNEKFSINYLLIAIKMPSVWLVTILIFALYSIYALQSYTTPYMQNVLGISTATVGLVGIIRQYGIGLMASPIGGIFADKIGSAAKVVGISCAVVALCVIGFLVLPTSMAPIIFIVLIITVAFLIYAGRGTQWATMKEAGIPTKYVGTATGIISFFGYTPDLYIYAQVGTWLDEYPVEQAYNMIWWYMIGMSILAVAASLGILFYVKKRSNESKKELVKQSEAQGEMQ
ncbi:MFS transporter [Escherichia coli]